MSNLANQPAFPGISDSRAGVDSYNNAYTAFEQVHGMTLRQYYAGLAMQALLANPSLFGPNLPEWMPDKVSDAAINNADALISELEK
jgi:hypothetical protein